MTGAWEPGETGTAIERVLIVGAGAVGCSVASIIDDRLPRAVSILADGERAERCRRDGFLVNGRRRFFPVVGRDAAGPAGLVIVCVKTYQLAAAIEDMRPAVGPGTLVLSLLNGITSEDDLAAAFGAGHVPLAMILGIDAVREGASTRFSSAGRIHFGDAKNQAGAWSARVAAIARFFDRAGVGYVVPEDMVRTLWFKFMINVGINQVSAVLRAPYRLFQQVPEARHAMESAMAEVIALSRTLGTGLTEADIPAWYRALESFAPDNLTSMAQDAIAGRPTEVEAFAGTVVELGRRTGVPTPVNAFLRDLLLAGTAAGSSGAT